LGAAFVTALLPVFVALIHLAPAASAEPSSHHHRDVLPVEAGVLAAAVEPDCHPPGIPCDEKPRQTAGHCPLCFWLQGLHVLPVPDTTAAPLPNSTAVALSWHEPVFVTIRLSITAQPRAPPVSLPA
jgi:hypothetical protein